MNGTEIHELSAAYALDALDPDERDAFEAHLDGCAECLEAVAAFQETAAELAHDVDAPAPPPELRDRVLAGIREEQPQVVELRRRTRRWSFPVAVAAAFAGGALALGLAFWAGDLSQQLDAERLERHLVEETALLLADPDTRRIGLDGASGVLVVDDETGVGRLVVFGLDAASDEQTYEAWVIADGEATAAGLFAGGDRTVVTLTEPVPPGALVAVTLEAAGGVEQSTQDPVFVTEQAA